MVKNSIIFGIPLLGFILLEILAVKFLVNLLLDVRTITFVDCMLVVDKPDAGGVFPAEPFIVLVFLVVEVFPCRSNECLHTIGIVWDSTDGPARQRSRRTRFVSSGRNS